MSLNPSLSSSQSVLPTPSSSSLTTDSPTTSTTPSSTKGTSSSTTPSSTSGSTTSQSTTSSSSGSLTTQSSTSTSSLGTTPSTSQFVTASGGTQVTVVVTTSPSSTSAPTTNNNTSSSNSFFKNTGAVAGVFTAVGLVVLVLAIIFIVNAVRRRRAQKFDRDVAEAAAEAVAASHSPFDDYSYPNTGGNSNGGGGGGGGGGGYGYSDNSHGTYQLPPLQPNEQYGMTEMSQYDPYAAGAASMAAAAAVGRTRSRKESEPGAPGIAGVGAGSLAREPSKRAPYHAFAGPGPQPHELQGGNGTMRSRRNQDMLEAAGLAGAGGAPVARKPSETTQNTHYSSRSQQFGSMSSHHQPGVTPPGALQPGYPVVDSYYPQRHDTFSSDPFAAAYPPVPTVAASQASLPNPHEAMQQPPSPPLPGHQSDHNEDIGDTGSPTALRSDEQRMSYQDDVDYSQGHRVLRVANE